MSDLQTTAVEDAKCLLCAGRLVGLHRFGDRWVAYCQACALGQLVPLPSDAELAALYGSRNYFEGSDRVGYSDYAVDTPQFERTFRRKLDSLLAHGKVHDLFEVGCGTGLFLREARRAGVERVFGLDRNPWAIEQVRSMGIEGEVGSVDSLAAADQFDAAVMLDLLEHVTDPLPFLREVRTHLRPGGLLFVMTPNIRSLLARVSGARWVSFKIPEHVFYYSPRSIRILLERAGFEFVTIAATGQYVRLDFLVDRLRRIAPPLAALIGAAARALRLTQKAVFVNNGSIDVVARVRPGL